MPGDLRSKAGKTRPKKRTVRVELVSGVEGLCIYLNGFRIVGPKPWGGGQTMKEWTVTEAEINEAMGLRHG